MTVLGCVAANLDMIGRTGEVDGLTALAEGLHSNSTLTEVDVSRA